MTEETPVPVQTANQAIDLAATDIRKEAENTAKAHINSIWHSFESWTVEKIHALIKDLEKHV